MRVSLIEVQKQEEEIELQIELHLKVIGAVKRHPAAENLVAKGNAVPLCRLQSNYKISRVVLFPDVKKCLFH